MPFYQNLQNALRATYKAKNKLSVPILDNEEQSFSIADSYVNLALVRNNLTVADNWPIADGARDRLVELIDNTYG